MFGDAGSSFCGIEQGQQEDCQLHMHASLYQNVSFVLIHFDVLCSVGDTYLHSETVMDSQIDGRLDRWMDAWMDGAQFFSPLRFTKGNITTPLFHCLLSTPQMVSTIARLLEAVFSHAPIFS